MSHLKYLSVTLLLLFLFGCSKQPDTDSKNIIHNNVSPSIPSKSPSSNSALNAVSPNTHKHGYLQNSYDRWEKEEWEPAMADEHHPSTPAPVEKTPETVPVTTPESSVQKDDNNFTLQHFYDKWNRYLEKEEKERDPTPSHVERLDTMPAIGK